MPNAGCWVLGAGRAGRVGPRGKFFLGLVAVVRSFVCSFGRVGKWEKWESGGWMGGWSGCANGGGRWRKIKVRCGLCVASREVVRSRGLEDGPEDGLEDYLRIRGLRRLKDGLEGLEVGWVWPGLCVPQGWSRVLR